MFGRRTTAIPNDRAPFARGSATAISVLTGVVVSFGAMFLLLAIIGGVLVSLNYVETDVSTGDAIRVGIGAGIAFAIAQFLSYLWGGYAAGRMGRGAGLWNGIAVPLVAILLALVVGGIVTALGANANLNVPFSVNRLPVQNNYIVDWGVGISIVSLVAMFLGGAIGGLAGAHWHTKLERKVFEEEQSEAIARNEELTRNEVVTTDDRTIKAPPPSTSSTATDSTTSDTTTVGTSDGSSDSATTRTFRS
ncbi:MAG: hypothetical protein QOH90_1013 [Actinomycetota bacterium]|nr:hypothetical protein [Actinomycetota bacterium]